MSTKLGQLLLSKGIITEEQLNRALDVQKKEGGRIASNLVKLEFLSEDTLIDFLSQQYHVPAVDLSGDGIDPSIVKYIPYDVAHKYQIFPISKTALPLPLP